MKIIFRLSLRGMLYAILITLFIPALTLGSLGFFQAKAQGENLEEARQQIDQINKKINFSVMSPFYLSPRVFDPCAPESLKLVRHPSNWSIQYQTPQNKRAACEWTYFIDRVKIAIDSWSDYDRKLASRVYFQHGDEILATDTFFVLDELNQVSCVKQREYVKLGVTECYSEAGKLISIDPIDNLFSPLPPMLYWFSYR